MEAHRFADLEGFLAAIREHGARGSAQWRPAGMGSAEWSAKAFDLAASSVYSVDLLVSAGIDLLLQNELTLGRIHVARLAIELYGAGAPFADVRCEVPIEWTTNAAGERCDIYADEIPAHHSGPVHPYTSSERAVMRRALELATYSLLGLSEGEIKAWQARGAS